MEEIMLSICVPTYGHERYIAEALESILMQETSYSYEILVGEDVSPDGTRAILKTYEHKYPEKFTMFYREKNMHSQAIGNSKDLRLRARGKYIITLEGDDFWLDAEKIDKQICFLENHPDYIAVAHNCIVVDENSVPNGEVYPECKQEEYTLKHFRNNIMPGQCATVMSRNYYLDKHWNTYLLDQKFVVGDRPLYFSLISQGKVFCLQDPMSAYRHVVNKGTSFSAKNCYIFENNEHMYREMMKYSKMICNKEAYICAGTLYLSTVLTGLKRKKINIKKTLELLSNLEYKLNIVVSLFDRLITRAISRKKNKNIIS